MTLRNIGGLVVALAVAGTLWRLAARSRDVSVLGVAAVIATIGAAAGLVMIPVLLTASSNTAETVILTLAGSGMSVMAGIVGALLFSLIAADLSPRWTPVMVAVWFAARPGIFELSSLLHSSLAAIDEAWPARLFFIALPLAMASCVTLWIAARRLTSKWFVPELPGRTVVDPAVFE
jgi:hypothetical protein